MKRKRKIHTPEAKAEAQRWRGKQETHIAPQLARGSDALQRPGAEEFENRPISGAPLDVPDVQQLDGVISFELSVEYEGPRTLRGNTPPVKMAENLTVTFGTLEVEPPRIVQFRGVPYHMERTEATSHRLSLNSLLGGLASDPSPREYEVMVYYVNNDR